MTGKKLFATIFVLVALVVWGATTPNVTVAADQLRTRDRLQDTTCLTTPIKDQTRDRLHTSTTTVVSGAQLQQTAAPTAAATATLPLANQDLVGLTDQATAANEGSDTPANCHRGRPALAYDNLGQSPDRHSQAGYGHQPYPAFLRPSNPPGQPDSDPLRNA